MSIDEAIKAISHPHGPPAVELILRVEKALIDHKEDAIARREIKVAQACRESKPRDEQNAARRQGTGQ
jgi:hypothetical protein